ncbi:hypothetical protein SHIRM173S_05950 [Streptomyces hirsutus]
MRSGHRPGHPRGPRPGRRVGRLVRDSGGGADARGAARAVPYGHTLVERGPLDVVRFGRAEEVGDLARHAEGDRQLRDRGYFGVGSVLGHQLGDGRADGASSDAVLAIVCRLLGGNRVARGEWRLLCAAQCRCERQYRVHRLWRRCRVAKRDCRVGSRGSVSVFAVLCACLRPAARGWRPAAVVSGQFRFPTGGHLAVSYPASPPSPSVTTGSGPCRRPVSDEAVAASIRGSGLTGPMATRAPDRGAFFDRERRPSP